MKFENALFCIISISDLGRLGRLFEFSSFRKKNRTRWTFCIRKQFIKREFLKKSKKSNFWCCLGILDIYGRAFLITSNICLFSCFPVFRSSGFPIFRFSDFPIFRISGSPAFLGTTLITVSLETSYDSSLSLITQVCHTSYSFEF